MYRKGEPFHFEVAFADYVKFLQKYYAASYTELNFSCLGEEEKVYLDDLHDLFDTLQFALVGYYRLHRKMEDLEALNGKLGHKEDCTCTCDVCFTATGDVFEEVVAIRHLAEKSVDQDIELRELDEINESLVTILEEEYNHFIY